MQYCCSSVVRLPLSQLRFLVNVYHCVCQTLAFLSTVSGLHESAPCTVFPFCVF